jgi:deoxyribose-phosphate aldolase
MTETTLTSADAARLIDHTLLKPEATRADVDALIAEAVELGTYSVCVSPSMLPLVLPEGTDLKVAVVAGFPSGKHTSAVKAAEAAEAVRAGADEVDMVIDVGAAVAGDYASLEDAIVGACKAAESAGADFVKTSTGFHPAGGASEHAVRLMAETVGGRLGVKASGGVRTLADAQKYVAAGATRLGVSGSRALLADSAAASSGAGSY